MYITYYDTTQRGLVLALMYVEKEAGEKRKGMISY